MVVYISKSNRRQKINWLTIKTCKGFYDFDTGDGYHNITLDNINYSLRAPMVGRSSPTNSSSYQFVYDTNHSIKENNKALEIAKYSMIFELVIRVQKGYVGCDTEDAKYWYRTRRNFHGGYQIGNNWEEIDPIELGVTWTNTSTGGLTSDLATSKKSMEFGWYGYGDVCVGLDVNSNHMDRHYRPMFKIKK